MKIFRKGLACLRAGSTCEQCRQPMRSHDWVDMDRDGFVIECCNMPFSRDEKKATER